MSSAIPIPRNNANTNISSSPSSSSPLSEQKFSHTRRSSLLSSSLSKQEHVVFDLGVRDGAPRLVTCVKTGQGFDWNQEMFLPPSSDIMVQPLMDRVDAVHEIILSEEEYNEMLPS